VRDAAQRFVRDLDVVTPDGRRRAQQHDVGGGHRSKVQRCVVAGENCHLAAPADGDDHDADHDHGSYYGHYNEHVQNRAMLTE
jgi:hypothetical protein